MIFLIFTLLQLSACILNRKIVQPSAFTKTKSSNSSTLFTFTAEGFTQPWSFVELVGDSKQQAYDHGVLTGIQLSTFYNDFLEARQISSGALSCLDALWSQFMLPNIDQRFLDEIQNYQQGAIDVGVDVSVANKLQSRIYILGNMGGNPMTGYKRLAKQLKKDKTPIPQQCTSLESIDWGTISWTHCSHVSTWGNRTQKATTFGGNNKDAQAMNIGSIKALTVQHTPSDLNINTVVFVGGI